MPFQHWEPSKEQCRGGASECKKEKRKRQPHCFCLTFGKVKELRRAQEPPYREYVFKKHLSAAYCCRCGLFAFSFIGPK